MAKLTSLFENNRRWSERIKKEQPDFFKQLSSGQKPEYLWIGCADSRVPANQIMDLNPGEVFVHRNIANLVVHSDINSQSVIQYAVDVLKVRHIIVCGHYGCGGVQAAMQDQPLGLIDNWLQHIRDVFDDHSGELAGLQSYEQQFRTCCEINVRAQVLNVSHTPFVRRAWKNGQELSVHGLIYDLHDGLLKDLGLSVNRDTYLAESGT